MAKSVLPYAISRTLDPTSKGLTSVLGVRDKRITDADINLIQDLQDYKRLKLVDNQMFSGCLSYNPFVYTEQSYTLTIPVFSVGIMGEVVTIGGHRSSDEGLNLVRLPQAPTGSSSNESAAIQIVYLELWWKALDAETGAGYATTDSGYAFYPDGCVTADATNYINDDSKDPFNNIYTSKRVQLQWTLRTTQIPMSYDFTKYRFGLDPVPGDAGQVYGIGSSEDGIAPYNTEAFKFKNVGEINGDYGLWRSGDGNPLNDLGTIDGYTYAMPVAVVFQRNRGVFNIGQNPFGTGVLGQDNSGSVLSRVSGRYDQKFHDVVYEDDVVDTRLSVFLEGQDYSKILETSFYDLVSGRTKLKIARGDGIGIPAIAMGSRLNYYINFSPSQVNNTVRTGSFDGYRGGFGATSVVYNTSKVFSINQKSVGTNGVPWAAGDKIVIDISDTTSASVRIASVGVQTILFSSIGVAYPAVLLGGQCVITGIGTQKITITLSSDLVGSSFDPKSSPIVVKLGVSYPASSEADLRIVPDSIDGGALTDGVLGGKVFPVFPVSQYKLVQEQAHQSAERVDSINPDYSDVIAGTLVTISSTSSDHISATTGKTSYRIRRTGVDNRLTGHHVVKVVTANNPDTPLVIQDLRIRDSYTYFSVVGEYQPTEVMLITVLCQDTVQISYNPAIKGVTSIEHVVLLGDPIKGYDSRVSLYPPVRHDVATAKNYITMITKDAHMTGVLGAVPASLIKSDTIDKYVWVNEGSGDFVAYPITNLVIADGVVTFECSGVVNLSAPGTTWYVLGTLRAALRNDSKLILAATYTPYQGEGMIDRDYEVLYADDKAVVTTNGTGDAPVVGLADVYPYKRDTPIATKLPARTTWSDADLKNDALMVGDTNNYEAKRGMSIEHTIEVGVYTNDYLTPSHTANRKKIRLTLPGGRGFSSTVPYLGFAIKKPRTRDILGDSVQTTSSPVVIYINNVDGNDLSDGFSVASPKKTLRGAISVLPPVLHHPVTVVLTDTGVAYDMASMTLDKYQISSTGEDNLYYYSLADLSFTIQRNGRLIITKDPNATTNVTINASGAITPGDGDIHAFYVSDSKITLNGLTFVGFTKAAIRAIDSDVLLSKCAFSDSSIAVSASQGSLIRTDSTTFTLGDGQRGIVLSDSSLEVSGDKLVRIAGTTPEGYYVGGRRSDIALLSHNVITEPTNETSITSATRVLVAELSTSVTCGIDWVSNGKSVLSNGSIMTRSSTQNPFLGGVEKDSSCNLQIIL